MTIGAITKDHFEEGFREVKEATGLELVHRLDYIIWKAIAQN